MDEGTLAPVEGKGYLLLQGDTAEDAFQQAVMQHFGCGPPGPGRAAMHGNAALLWMTPREWLIELSVAEVEPAQQAFTARLRGILAAVTDVTDSFAVFDLADPGASAALSAGCTVDLSPATFGPGRVARCSVAQMSAILWKIDSQRFRCLVDRSLTAYFCRWLSLATW